MFVFCKKIFFLIFISLMILGGCNSDSKHNNSDGNITKNKTKEVYVDRATLPTIQQMTQIINENSNNKKLISWSRYPINDETLLESINGSFFKNRPELIKSLDSMILTNEIKKVIINGNTLWAVDVVNIIKSIEALGKKTEIELNFYDDGSAEYVRLYDFSRLPESEQEYKISLSKDNIQSSINGTQPFDNSIENIYGFSQLYPTTYHMLRADIFETNLPLTSLKRVISNNIKQMKWDYFTTFNSQQKNKFYNFTGFNPEKIKEQYKASPHENFIFIGTNSGTATAEQQIDILTEAKKPDSPIITNSIQGLDLFFKGHPSATYNQQIIDAHNMIEIYNKIPFEALIMTDALPDAVGGMGSSVFFSLPNTVENKFIFYKSDTDIENNALIQVMIELNIVNRNDVKLISDLQ